MNKTVQDEIDFLKGYVEFSVEARVLEVEVLWNAARNMKPSDNRALLFLIAIESFFMQQETLYKFLKATRSAVLGKDYLSVLMKTTFNPLQDTANISSLDDLKIVYPPRISEAKRLEINNSLNGVIKTCIDLSKANEVFSNVYNCLKHGLLVYKKDTEILALMHQEKENIFVNYLKDSGVKGKKDSIYNSDFGFLVDLNKRISIAIKELIAVRLLQLGVTSL